MEDYQIIELYELRDERAIEETSAKYGAYCFSVANNILADKLDAEECVNDALMKLWSSIPPEKPTSLKAFAAKITRNLSFNRYNLKTAKKRGGGEMEMTLSEIEEFLSDTTDVASEFERRELVKALNRFLYSLAERERNIFICRYFYMDSVADIAKAFSVKESNVLTILSRTRKKLRITLEREGLTV